VASITLSKLRLAALSSASCTTLVAYRCPTFALYHRQLLLRLSPTRVFLQSLQLGIFLGLAPTFSEGETAFFALGDLGDQFVRKPVGLRDLERRLRTQLAAYDLYLSL
jgi:hypothetical protein